MDGSTLPGIEKSVWLPASPERVWGHLTDGDLLETWFGGSASIIPRPGGRIELDVGEGPLRWGTIEVVAPERRIQWSWRTGEGDPSLVVIDLEPEDDGTRLIVTETLLEYRIEHHPARHDLPMRWAG